MNTTTVIPAIGTARVASFVIDGLRARQVTVTVHLHPGSKHLVVRGLADAAAREMHARLCAGLPNAGFAFPDANVHVSIDGTRTVPSSDGLDLPAALAILAASGQPHQGAARELERIAVVGCMALGGQLRRARGTFLAAEAAARAERELLSGGDCPDELEGASADPVRIPQSLAEAVASITPDGGFTHIAPQVLEDPAPAPWRRTSPDLASIVGQPAAIRALQVAAIGRHRLLLLGDVGVGKRQLARRLPALMGAMSPAARRGARRAQSAMALAPSTDRPFVTVSRTSTVRGLTGGGSSFRPGWLTLANDGVLYLPDVAGMAPKALEATLQAVDAGWVSLEHDGEARSFASEPLLVAATTPCRCGGGRRCRCTTVEKAGHMAWLRRELFSHFDLVVHVHHPTESDIADHQAISTATANAQIDDACDALAYCAVDPRHDPALRLAERVAFELAALDGASAPSDAHHAEARAIASPTR